MTGVYFYRVLWRTSDYKYHETIEAAHTRRWLGDQIKKGNPEYLRYFDGDAQPAKCERIQPTEMPVIDMKWLSDALKKAIKKSDPESVDKCNQAAYVLNLVKMAGARVAEYTDDGELMHIIER